MFLFMGNNGERSFLIGNTGLSVIDILQSRTISAFCRHFVGIAINLPMKMKNGKKSQSTDIAFVPCDS